MTTRDKKAGLPGRPDPILLLTEREIRDLVGLDAGALAEVEQAFSSLALGRADVPPIVGLAPDGRGEVDVKAAYLHGRRGLVVKIASGGFDNARLGLPGSSGLMIVVSAETGFPAAVLLDNGYLTDVRTGLAGAAAAKHLAPEGVRTVGVIGAGAQGRWQVRALRLVRTFDRVLVHDTASAAAEAYAREMPGVLAADDLRTGGPVRGPVVVAAADPQTLVRESQVVITSTPSRTPVVRAAWLHPGLHITAMGADVADKQELESAVLARATRLACDLKAQCVERGEFLHAIRAGVLDPSADVIELGELTSGRRRGREREDEISVCALTGVGVQDAAIALVAFDRAAARGLGTTVPAAGGTPA